jgi:hypothetical protein
LKSVKAGGASKVQSSIHMTAGTGTSGANAAATVTDKKQQLISEIAELRNNLEGILPV